MERKSPYLGVISGVLLLLAAATPFLAPLVVPAPAPQPEQPGSQQNAQAWEWLGAVIMAIFAMIALGLIASLFAIASLIRREKYRLLPILVILIGGGGSAYLLFALLHR